MTPRQHAMERLLTPKQLSDLLQVRPSTVYEWAHMGFVPHVKLGKCLRFKPKEIERWMQARSQHGRKTRKLEITVLPAAMPSKELGTQRSQPAMDASVECN